MTYITITIITYREALLIIIASLVEIPIDHTAIQRHRDKLNLLIEAWIIMSNSNVGVFNVKYNLKRLRPRKGKMER